MFNYTNNLFKSLFIYILYECIRLKLPGERTKKKISEEEKKIILTIW